MENVNGEWVATNASTGEKVVHRNGAWVPYAPKSQGLGEKIVGLGKQAEAGYESIAKPVTTAVAKGLGAAERTILPGFGAPGEMALGLLAAPSGGEIPLPQGQAQALVPQTIPQAAYTAGSFVLPEAKAAQRIGEIAGPLTRVIGTRMGRIATLTGIGAATGAATGQGALSGAEEAAGAVIPGETASMLYGMAGRRVGLPAFIRKTTKALGSEIQDIIPWLGKVKTGGDLEEAFVRGRATQTAAQRLGDLKTRIGGHPKVQGKTFNVPAITPQGVQTLPLPFAEADAMVREMNHQGFMLSGQQRGAASADAWRQLSHQVRERIGQQLNSIQPGLGDAYLKANRNYATARALSHVFSEPGVLGQNGVDQPALIEALLKPKYQSELSRTMGQPNVDRLLNNLRRGYKGAGTDIPPKGGHLGVSVTPYGAHAFGRPGRSYQAMGKVPGYMRPSGQVADATAAAIERAAQTPKEEQGPALVNTPGGEPWNQPGAGTKSLDQSRAEHIAPTASAADRAERVGKDLTKGKTPDVHHDLNRGRLSMDEVNKLLKHGAKTDAMAMIDDVPLTEAMDAAELANPAERLMLMPLIQRKMQEQFKGGQYNRTLAANLARRFQKLQGGATNVSQAETA